MTLAHLILGPLGMALAMMVLGWLLESPGPHAPAPSPRDDEWDRPFGDWESEAARPARAPIGPNRDEAWLRWD